MKYELNKTYITNNKLTYVDIQINQKITITRIKPNLFIDKYEYFVNYKGKSIYLSQGQMDNLKLVSEETSFTMHVLKYTPQDMTEIEYRTWLNSKLVEETQEVIDVFKELEFNIDHLKEELGDVFYFFTAICERYDLTLDEIKEANIKKLQTRFQKGYWNKKEADLKRDHSNEIFNKGCEQLQQNINKANNEGTITHCDGDSVTYKKGDDNE